MLNLYLYKPAALLNFINLERYAEMPSNKKVTSTTLYQQEFLWDIVSPKALIFGAGV